MATDGAASSAALNLSTVEMSGFGAPAFTATPTPTEAIGVTTISLPSLAGAVGRGRRQDGEVERVSALDPPRDRPRRVRLDRHLVAGARVE